MSRRLPVDVNRERRHHVDPEVDAFEPTGDFVVAVRNHGEGTHVHLGLAGDLAENARVSEGNPFVGTDETVEVPVEIRTDIRPVEGSLELAAGYGDEREAVAVTVRGDEDGAVVRAADDADDDGPTTPPLPGDAAPVLGLALLAVALAAVVVAVIDSAVVVLGALLVIGTALVGTGYVLAN